MSIGDENRKWLLDNGFAYSPGFSDVKFFTHGMEVYCWPDGSLDVSVSATVRDLSQLKRIIEAIREQSAESQSGEDFAKWREDVRRHKLYPQLLDAELEHAWRLSMQHGPANCWAGTTGELARVIRLLLIEIVLGEGQ